MGSAAVLVVVLLSAGIARAETLDRVVAAVGAQAITASDVEREYRLELLLGGQTPTSGRPDAATLSQVRERLIDRTLLEFEVAAAGVKVSPDASVVQQRLDGIRRKFPSVEAYQSALAALGLSEEALREILATQQAILNFIDQRWRPLAAVESSEIEAYYRDTLLPELARRGQPAPLLKDVESRIRELLVQKKIDGLLDTWLKRARTERGVQVFGSAGLEAAS